MRFDPTLVSEWKTATKTKPIVAKHVSAGLSDSLFLEKMLVNTLEGREPITATNVICVGEAGDVWQQTPAKLFAKYFITGMRPDGWLICEPKPDNEVDCFEVPDFSPTQKNFEVIGLWGETAEDGTKNVQRGVVGDFVCRSKTDRSDVWIVRRSFFNSTYQIKD